MNTRAVGNERRHEVLSKGRRSTRSRGNPGLARSMCLVAVSNRVTLRDSIPSTSSTTKAVLQSTQATSRFPLNRNLSLSTGIPRRAHVSHRHVKTAARTLAHGAPGGPDGSGLARWRRSPTPRSSWLATRRGTSGRWTCSSRKWCWSSAPAFREAGDGAMQWRPRSGATAIGNLHIGRAKRTGGAPGPLRRLPQVPRPQA